MLVSDDTVVISMTTVFAFQGLHQFFHRKVSGFAQPLFQRLLKLSGIIMILRRTGRLLIFPFNSAFQ